MKNRLVIIGGLVALTVGIAGISMAAEVELEVDGIGTLTVDETDGMLTLTGQDLGEWTVIRDESTPDEIELYITDKTTTIKVEVGVEDGELKATLKDVTVPESDDVESDHESDDDPGDETKAESAAAVAPFSETFAFPADAGSGSVIVQYDGAVLTATVEGADGWVCSGDDSSDDDDELEVKIRCSNEVLGLEFEAELDDWVLKTEWKVKDDSDDESDDREIKETLEAAAFTSEMFTHPDLPLSVEVSLTDGALTATGTADEGWSIDPDNDESDLEVKVRFFNDVLGLKVEFKAELEHGELTIKWKVDEESDDKRDHSSDDDDDAHGADRSDNGHHDDSDDDR